jgi:predicted transcriptional regulator
MARNKSRKTHVYFQMETELLDKLDALAAQEDRSRASLVRRMLLRELERMTTPPAQAQDANAA